MHYPLNNLQEYDNYKHRQPIQWQRALCEKHGIPMFMPSDGSCYHCGRYLFTPYGYSDDAAKYEIITSCPYCHTSFVD